MSLSCKIGQIARFFILISLVSCKNDVEQKSLIKSITYTVDTVRIDLDKNQLYDYPRSSVFKTDSIDYFYGYNQSLHRLDIFSLTEGEFINSIPLNTDGPNAIDSPFDFFIHQPDSIFFYGKNYSLDIINDLGIVFGKDLIPSSRNSSHVGKQKVGYLSNSVHFKLYFDSELNSVFFHSYSMESIPNKSAYYEVPILAEINLQMGKVKDYPFHFPDSYLLDGEYLGEYMNPNMVLSDSLIIYSFPNSPVVNVYDRKNGKLISRTIESGFSKNTVKSLPSETYSEIHLRLNHLIENPYFYHTVFDPFRNLFYRTHRGEHPNPDLNLGNLNFSYTKDYLTVMDHNLNLLQEIELPAHKYDALSFFVTKDGLYFPYTHYLNEEVKEDKLVFHIYKFHFESED